MKRLYERESVVELGRGFEDKREGVEIRGERETAEREEEVDGRERGREESVDSDEGVVGEWCWVWNGMEEGECVGC